MPRCPFCGEELEKYLPTERTLQQIARVLVLFRGGRQCPRCGKGLGLRSFGEFEDFLEDKLAVILKEKAKIKRNFALYDGEVYEILREEKSDDGTEVLIAKRITDEPRASIIAASFCNEEVSCPKEDEIKNLAERIDRIESDLTEHIYKPLAKGIGISTALLGILLAVSSSLLAIPAFIISYLCFRGLWKSKKRDDLQNRERRYSL